MIALQDPAYYVPRLPNNLRIISSQGIHTPELYKGAFIVHYHDDYDINAEFNLKEVK